jgi:hypothetical protein
MRAGMMFSLQPSHLHHDVHFAGLERQERLSSTDCTSYSTSYTSVFEQYFTVFYSILKKAPHKN